MPASCARCARASNRSPLRGEIATALDRRTEVLAAKREATIALLRGQPALSKLGNVEREWSRYGAKLAGWRRTLTRQAAALEVEVTALKQSQAVWDATQQAAEADDAPAEVLGVIAASEKDLKAARKSATARRSDVLTLQNRVAQQELIVSEMQEALQDMRADVRSRLFEPDDVPIWRVFDAEAQTGDHAADAVALGFLEVETYAVQKPGRFLTLGFVFFFAWLIARALAASVSARTAGGAEVERALLVFRRPVAMALLFTS